MKRNDVPFLRLFLIIGLLATTLVKAQQAASLEENLVVERINSPSLSKNLIDIPAIQKIVICLPPGYLQNKETRYPVLYFLTGYGDDPDYYVNELYQGLKMHESLRSLIEAKQIKEMIVVIISGTNFLGGSFFVNSEVGGNWEDFLIKDVVGYIDSKYRTKAAGQSRGIAGHSMGGFGAINFGMKYPDVFGSLFALSPGLFDKNGLANSPMFADPVMIERFIKCESDNNALPKEEAHKKFREYCDNSSNMDFIFSIAYGMAFAPNAAKKAPYIDYPYSKSGGKIIQNKEIWKKWENGFGNWGEKIKTYKENFLKLRNICIEYASKEENKWRIDGCKNFVKLLNSEKIQAKLVTFDGNHSDKIRERIEKSMLPFFSKIFELN